MKKLLFLLALLVALPVSAQVQVRGSNRPSHPPQSSSVRSHTNRPPSWNSRPPQNWNNSIPTWNTHPRWSSRPPSWGWHSRPPSWGWNSSWWWHSSPSWSWGWSSWNSNWGWSSSRSRVWVQPMPPPATVTIGAGVGVFSINGFIWNNVRYVPVAPFEVNYPPFPRVFVITNGSTLIVDGVIITADNGRLTVFKEEENGQQ